MNRLSILLLSCFLTITIYGQKSKPKTPERVINVDYSLEKGPLNTMFNECVGAGRANEGLRADWQQQLTYIKNECGFRYIRFHGLLTDDMGVYGVDKKVV
ncbi:MAG TPA: hypothetical protein VIO15_11575 [Bacteroidales bacterium]